MAGDTPIQGYRTLTVEEVAQVNAVKTLAHEVGMKIEAMQQVPDYDQRWVAIAKTQLQQGFMALTRAITKPEWF